MRLDIRFPDPQVGREHAEIIERRTRFAFGRFGPSVRRAEITLRDANGPRGGRDKHCRVLVVLSGLAPVVVEVVDAEPLAAADRALERAARRVRDALSRRRDVRRCSPAGSAGGELGTPGGFTPAGPGRAGRN